MIADISTQDLFDMKQKSNPLNGYGFFNPKDENMNFHYHENLQCYIL
jgi:hypothetical protein